MTVTAITDRLKKQLIHVVPSKCYSLEYRPCQVILKTGETRDNVYIQEENSYLKAWGVMPDSDLGKTYVLIEDILEIRESPNRLPYEIANKIYKAGESGMGYSLFKLMFADGQSLDVCAGNAVDFISLPDGFEINKIIDVLPHQASRQNFLRASKYEWCLYNGNIPNFY